MYRGLAKHLYMSRALLKPPEGQEDAWYVQFKVANLLRAHGGLSDALHLDDGDFVVCKPTKQLTEKKLKRALPAAVAALRALPAFLLELPGVEGVVLNDKAHCLCTCGPDCDRGRGDCDFDLARAYRSGVCVGGYDEDGLAALYRRALGCDDADGTG